MGIIRDPGLFDIKEVILAYINSKMPLAALFKEEKVLCHENVCPHSTATRDLCCPCGNCFTVSLGGRAAWAFQGKKERVNKTGAEENLRKLGTSTSGFLPCQPL